MVQDLLVHLDAGDGERACTTAALDLAHRLGSRVLGVCVLTPIRLPGYVAVDIPAFALEAARKSSIDILNESGRRFREAAAAASVEAEWRMLEGDPAVAVIGLARTAALVVMAQPQDDDSTARALLDDVTIGAGRPVLLVPAGGAPVGFGEHVMVAWNASREATGALHEALPLLRHAKRVVLVTAGDGQQDTAGLAPVVAHLQRHRVAAQARHLRASGGEAGDALLSLAAEEGMDLLVMGAWGHSRLREMVLGGVTAHVIAHTAMPVLLSH